MFGTEKITPEVLLLDILQQRPPLEFTRLIGRDADHWDELRKQIEENIPRGNPVPLSADIPVSQELERVFQHAIKEMSGTGLETAQPGHLVIGILREEGCHATELLRANGVELELVRQRVLDHARRNRGSVSVHAVLSEYHLTGNRYLSNILTAERLEPV